MGPSMGMSAGTSVRASVAAFFTLVIRSPLLESPVAYDRSATFGLMPNACASRAASRAVSRAVSQSHSESRSWALNSPA
eukprot:3611176-Pyramimonas_sp.AAC.1